ALFGTNDKIALLIGIGIVLVGVAAVAGLVELKWPPFGLAIMVAFGGVGVLAAMTRANPGQLDWVPSLVAGITAAVALSLLIARVPGRARPPVSTSPMEPDAAPVVARPEPAVERRTFLLWTVGTAAVGVLATIGSTLARAGAQAVTVVRDALTLPAPASAAAPIPATAELGITGLAPVITPNAQFYRIDTALIVPQVDPADWSLRIHGMVANEVTITWDELLALPLEESVTTLACVSNNVGGELIGNALWLGYPIRELLARAAPTADADMVLSHSIDGFTASSPIEALTDDRNAILAVGMNGEPLPAEHGFPVRMVVPGLYGYVSATKWVTELEVTRFDKATAYWSTRGWSERGPIKLQSRIDVPKKQQGMKAGESVIAGVAWQQQVGVSAVEVQIDEGAWQPATLATAISGDTWVQWSMPWTATVGDHLIRCRATSATGELQTEELSRTDPDGATGWHERFITVFA
ncbi:MAG: molybdopterin-dependent oxidoreductase, partial [Microbacterium sp.]